MCIGVSDTILIPLTQSELFGFDKIPAVFVYSFISNRLDFDTAWNRGVNLTFSNAIYTWQLHTWCYIVNLFSLLLKVGTVHLCPFCWGFWVSILFIASVCSLDERNESILALFQSKQLKNNWMSAPQTETNDSHLWVIGLVAALSFATLHLSLSPFSLLPPLNCNSNEP